MLPLVPGTEARWRPGSADPTAPEVSQGPGLRELRLAESEQTLPSAGNRKPASDRTHWLQPVPCSSRRRSCPGEAWLGKQARLNFFRTSGWWKREYRHCWSATQRRAICGVFCFRNILVAKASKTFFLSLVRLIQPKIPAMLERDQAESVPHQ